LLEIRQIETINQYKAKKKVTLLFARLIYYIFS